MRNSMCRGYRLIFWGLLLAALHIQYGGYSVLPPLFGCLIVFFGLICILRTTDTPAWRRAKNAMFVVLILSLIDFVQPFVLHKEAILSLVILLWMVLEAVFRLLAVYGILAGTVEWLRSKGREDAAVRYEKRLNIYVLLFQLITLGNIIVTVCSSEIGSTAVFAAYAVLQIWLLVKIAGLRKISGSEDPADEPAEERELTETGENK